MLYPNRIRMLDVVFTELSKNQRMKVCAENLLKFNYFKEIKFPTEYLGELDILDFDIDGIGERSCLIYCKNQKHIIASSNTKDIKAYCEKYDIQYLTTLDIFAVAEKRGLLSKNEINKLIKKITKNDGSYLCCRTIENHIANHFHQKKLLL